jgi:hypothetical protein
MLLQNFHWPPAKKYRDKDGNIQTITDWHNVKNQFYPIGRNSRKVFEKKEVRFT